MNNKNINKKNNFRCHQFRVKYTPVTWQEWETQKLEVDSISWDMNDTKFLINSEGCGYPPRVNCSIFASEYL